MRRYRVAVIPGDGIGREVIPAGLEVLQALAEREGGFAWTFDCFDWGSDAFSRHGPDDAARRSRADQEPRRDLFRRSGLAGRDRSRQPLGPAPRDLSAVRPIRQRPSGARASRDRKPFARRERPGARLGDRAREFGGRICGRRRTRASRPAGGSRDRRHDHDPRRCRTNLPLRLRAGALAAAQAPDHGDEVERAASRDGDVGRNRRRSRAQFCRRDLGQDARRRHDDADDNEAGEPRYDRRVEPACRHSVRSRRGAGRLARDRADGQSQPRAPVPFDVRAYPRLGLRYRRQGNRQSDRRVLDRLHDARTSRRETRRGSA